MAAPTDTKKDNKPPFNPNQSPKQRFTSVAKWIGDHRLLVDSESFTRAIDMALLQYQQQATENITDGNGAGSAGLRIRGAIEFVRVLKNLSENPTAVSSRPDDNLRH